MLAIITAFLMAFLPVYASDDFTGYTVGLGTSEPIGFEFNDKVGPSPWSVFGRTGPRKAFLEDQDAQLSVEEGKEASIVTSDFSVLYGRVDWTAKVATGETITSFKLSAAHSGIELMVVGSKPNQIITAYNGTHDEANDIKDVGKNLTEAFHVYSIVWNENEISYLVDNVTYRNLKKLSWTKQIDIDNWPTTPTTVNFMVESIGKGTNNIYKAYLESILVTDFTGGKYYEHTKSGSEIKITKKGAKYKTVTGKTVVYPRYLKDWVTGNLRISKRDLGANSTSSGISINSTTSNTTSAAQNSGMSLTKGSFTVLIVAMTFALVLC